jgi:hypothetical protein
METHEAEKHINESESSIQARDTLEMIRLLHFFPCWLAGESSGARMSLLAAVHDSSSMVRQIEGLFIYNVTAGDFASWILSSHYYTQYSDLLRKSNGDIRVLMHTPYYRDMIARRGENKATLLKSDPKVLQERFDMWGKIIMSSASYPVIGCSSDQLAQIRVPVKIIHNAPDDNMHTVTAATQLRAALGNCSHSNAPSLIFLLTRSYSILHALTALILSKLSSR